MNAVHKTYKLYVGGQFVRSESGRSQRPEGSDDNIPRASRKDVRDAVVAARDAASGWGSRSGYNRGQILYRMAEMLDARRVEFARVLGLGGSSRREVEQSVDTLVWYAGWCDKLDHIAGTVNAVNGPHLCFTANEPTGIVGLVAPSAPPLLGLVRHLSPALAGGNTIVAIVSESHPIPALVLGEVVATSDVPAGVVNLLSGQVQELIPWLAGHRDINALDLSGCSPSQRSSGEQLAASSVTRVTHSDGRLSPSAILALMEQKTVWHPIGV